MKLERIYKIDDLKHFVWTRRNDDGLLETITTTTINPGVPIPQRDDPGWKLDMQHVIDKECFNAQKKLESR